MSIKKAGSEETFHWFFAKVEDRDDPLKLGRVKIRCFNLHTEDESKLPKDYLPWATPIQPITSAASSEIGVSPTGLTVGSIVWGFFADGNDAQIPLIIGSIAGIPKINDKEVHDISQRARGIDNLKNEYIEDVEPKMAFSAKYPYNKVITTESEGGKGHIIEIDDTPDHERLLVWHKKGSYVEINQDGRLVIKTPDNSFFLTVKDSTVYVGANCTIVVEGDAGIAVGKSATVEIVENLSANVGGNVLINTKGTTDIVSEGTISMSSNSDINIDASGNIKLKGSRIDLN